MEDWRQRLQALRERFDALPLAARVGIVSAGVLLLLGGIFAATTPSEPPMEVLYARLSAEEAARVVSRLEAMKVPYDLQDAGTTIRVPAEQVHRTRLTLAAEGLPAGGVGFELFDEQRFGESEFSERVKYHRALEGELSRTLTHLAAVERARVHLVLPRRSLFAGEQSAASASVVLHLKPGWQLRPEQVRGVVHLVASSVRGLSPESVTVVDGDGRPLGDVEGADGQEADKLHALQRRIERARERAVQQLLDETLGPGKARVKVAAEVELGSEEEVEEKFEPDTVATRSFQVVEERDEQAGQRAEGVPGAATNLPGGEVPEASQNQGALRKRSETRNYEVSKRVRTVRRPEGRLTRLQVAVLVDGKWTDKDGKRAFEPLSKEELQRIERVVARAAGVVADRGDEVTVECVPFAASAKPEPPDPFAAIRPYEPFMAPALVGLGVVLGVLGLFVARRRRRKRKAEEDEAAAKADALALREEAALAEAASDGPAEEAPPAIEAPTTVAELEAGLSEGQREALAESQKHLNEEMEELRSLAADLAAADPHGAARVLRGWIAESRAMQREATEQASAEEAAEQAAE